MMARSNAADWFWMVLVGVASLGLSRAFACVTPFAALAVVAALTLDGRRAAGLVLFTWLANQVVGFGLLGYPTDATTFAWGGAIGLAALAGLAAAWPLARAPAVLGLLGAFAAYEAVLLMATTVLPSGAGAFAPAVLAQMLLWNAAVLAVLRLAHWLAFRPGVVTSRIMPIR